MRKYILTVLLSAICFCSNLFAAYVSSDFSNQPPVNVSGVKRFASNDPAILLTNMVGDTINISYDGISSYARTARVEFELITPDTIWIKQVKKPKVNKHYFLCRALNGVKVDNMNYSDGSPFYKTPKFTEEPFVVEKLLSNDTFGRVCVGLTSVKTGKKIIWHIENKCIVTNLTQMNNMTSELADKPLCVQYDNSFVTIKNQYVKCQFEFRASVTSGSNNATTRVENNACLVISFEERYTSKLKNLYYYFGKGTNKYASYKFNSQEECEKHNAKVAAEIARVERLAKEDVKNDSNFIFPIVIESEIHDVITDQDLNLAHRTCYIYATTPSKIYGTDYLAYCNGMKIQIEDYSEEIDKADADKKAFLKRRGTQGAELREQLAIQYDKEQTEKDNVKAADYKKKSSAKKAEFVKKQIFLIEQFYTTGEYSRCGVGINIFNCYGKTIKYVDFTATAYNTFDDPQKDTMGNSQKSARCIGPINSKETGYFLFDELFWNENQVIQNCRITSVKITFTDNSTVSYSGWSNVKQHYQEYYFDFRNPIYMSDPIQ